MYDISLSVSACARSGTRADVVVMLAPVVTDDALAFTPGGGRIGQLMGGAFDGFLSDVAERKLSNGRRLRHTVTAIESSICGLETGTEVEFLLVPAEQFPAEIWPRLLVREAVTFTATLEDDVVTSVSLLSSVEQESAAPGPTDRPAIFVTDSEVTVVLAPITRLAIAGQGPIAEALAAQGKLLGWKVAVETRPGMVAGLAASSSPIDGIVVMGHDIEMSSTCLMHALESDAGYIGALGSPSMQVSRADWLAMREVTDLSRVHGPAGLEIGSQGPAEIAVSITAQMIHALRLG
jgi:xanthine dehydrogenase accessory factor